MHAYVLHTHNSHSNWSHDEGTQSWESERQRRLTASEIIWEDLTEEEEVVVVPELCLKDG